VAHREVLVPGGLDPSSIGVIGKISTSHGNVYVPLLISASKIDHALQGITSPKITFRAPLDIEIFQWRIYAAGGTAPSWNKYADSVYAGEPITLSLTALAGKEMTLDVAARPVGEDWIQSRFKIFFP
jgi:hypothetical protein